MGYEPLIAPGKVLKYTKQKEFKEILGIFDIIKSEGST